MITSVAKDLHDNNVHLFYPPERHGFNFFQAIVCQSSYFNMTPQELASELKSS